MGHSPWNEYDPENAGSVPFGPLLVKNNRSGDYLSPSVAFHWRENGTGAHLFGRPGESSNPISHWRNLLPDHPVAQWWEMQSVETRSAVVTGHRIYTERSSGLSTKEKDLPTEQGLRLQQQRDELAREAAARAYQEKFTKDSPKLQDEVQNGG